MRRKSDLEHCASRLRSFFICLTGFFFGLGVWLVFQPFIPLAHAETQAEELAVRAAWALLWGGLLLYGTWRYLLQPVRIIRRARTLADTLALLLAIFRLSLPFGVGTGALLALFGLHLPLPLQAAAFLTLIFVWDWMKARSQKRLVETLRMS